MHVGIGDGHERSLSPLVFLYGAVRVDGGTGLHPEFGVRSIGLDRF